MTNKERREIKKLVQMMREAGVRYRASKPVIELLEGGADEIERLAALTRSDAEPVKVVHDDAFGWGILLNGKPVKCLFTQREDAIDWLHTALAQSDAERIRKLEAECGRFENELFEARAALVQSDAEPVGWQYRCRTNELSTWSEWRNYNQELADQLILKKPPFYEVRRSLPLPNKERQKLLDDLLNLLNMFRQKADDCDIEFKGTADPAAASAAYAYTEAAGEVERLRARIKK